ncbi:MAG: D-aminoacylase, partial [Gemmatimonadetes bacterium]|nr:D-aminoacylase [Gemmatimonadota bacterium]
MRALRLLPLLLPLAACYPRGGVSTTPPAGGDAYSVVIENGRVVDGTGAAWFYGDVALRGDRIAAIGPHGAFRSARATQRIDASRQVVAPGFIDIQAQSYGNFMYGDGLALSMVTQGITTAILGEGDTPAPTNANTLALETDSAARVMAQRFAGPRGFSDWLEFMVGRGASQNIGSFVGNGTVRVYGKGGGMGPATPVELDTMRAMVRRVMEDGAFGIASALIYPPNVYASPEELTEINKAAAPYGGIYITHMRSEGDRFLEGIDEAIGVGRGAGVPVEIYHLKAAGVRNWPKMDVAIAKIDSARRAGQDVQADMYLYPAGGNSFASCIPPKYSANGKLLENLKNPALRATMIAEIHARDAGYENLCEAATPANVMVVGFRKPEYQRFEGKRLSEIAAAMNKDWAEVIIDLNVEENFGLGEILFLMSEENIEKQIRLPWMKFGTDAGTQDPARARGMVHPRAYGNYPRLLGKYVRERQATTLEDAVRKSS